MTGRALIVLTMLLTAVGCAVPPPTVQRVATHSVAAAGGGVLLVVDVCVSYSPLGTDDYFVVADSMQGAKALVAATQLFLDAADIRTRTALIPFVCGALHDTSNMPKRVADKVDGEIFERTQPLWVVPDVARDAEYLDALHTLATHIYRRSLAPYNKDTPLAPDSKTDTAANDELVRRAAVLVGQKSGRASMLYLGVTGQSLSSGKAAAVNVARVVAAMAISLAIGPIYTAGGAQYGVVFVPGGLVDKRQMAAGLFDLQQRQLVHSRVVGAGGDPMKPEVLAERNGLNLLLRDVILTANPSRSAMDIAESFEKRQGEVPK